MKAEELLEQHYNRVYTETKEGQTYPEYWPDYVVRAMKQYAIYCCEKQKEICAENAKTVRCPEYDKVNKDSIINSPLPEELQ